MDLSQVTLTQMRYAVGVAEILNFRAAAETLHVSQSGLSMQIQKLEEMLETELFDRSKKPILITPMGEPILSQMRVILRETQKLAQLAVDEHEPKGLYRLGVIPTLSSTLIPLFLKQFLATLPQVELVIEELKTEEIIARLRSDTLDAGLAATPLHVSGFHEHHLALEAMLAYLPPGDSLLSKQTITQQELAHRRLWVMPEGHCFRAQVLSYCDLSKAKNSESRLVQQPSRGNVTFESGSFETLIRLVDEGLGTTVLPALVSARLPKARLKQLKPLTSPVPAREIGLVTARSTLRRSITEVLAQILKQELQIALPNLPRRARVIDPVG